MIPDTHIVPVGWGIRPVLFTLGGLPVSSYAFFVGLGLVAAVGLYWFNVRGRTTGNAGLAIAAAAAIGGIVGAKVPVWIANAPAILAHPERIALLLSGRTIVGGIVGGALAVYLTKRRLHITQRLGNQLVPSLCLGIAIGRVGCFLAGCCYGIATSLPWGVDFGDGLLRHPTQLYEAFLLLGLFAYAQIMRDRYAPGALFRRFMIVYFAWRFLVEFVRVSPPWALGLSYYQVASAAIVAFYLFKVAMDSRRGIGGWAT